MNRFAIVTGASRGIGMAITTKLLDDSWQVIGTSRSGTFPDSLTSNPNFTGKVVDLSDLSAVTDRMRPLLLDRSPQLLVNNAGIFRTADYQIDDDQWLAVWQHTMQVNLTASALLCKWFINANMTNGKQGIIVNVASRAAYRGDTQEFAAYAASKGGMVAMTKSIARGYGRHGIVAYSIAPGFVETDMARESIEYYGKEYLTRDSSFEQMTHPSEVANLVAFLASGQVQHMTGSTFHINGGSYML